MTITAFSGPLVTFREGGGLPLQSAAQNPDSGPSLLNHSYGLLDPRTAYTYFPGASNAPGYTKAAVGWLNAEFQTVDYAPGTASTTSLANGASVATTTSVALITASAGNITVGSSVVNPQNGQTVTGLWLIDNVPGFVTYGQTGSIAMWDPANPAMGRAVSITSTGDVSGLTFTVSGYDAYGNPISQTLTGGTTSTSVFTGKTFKWVSAVSASTTSSTTVSVGVSDIYGFPLYAGALAYLNMWFNNVPITGQTTVSATFVAGSAATTAGATDVRGTISISNIAASNGIRKMQLWQYVSPANIASIAGLFGTQPPA